MFTRTVVTASAAALALVALSVPVVNAQDGATDPGDPGAGSLSLGSLEADGLGAGSLPGGSADGAGDDSTDGDVDGDGGDGDSGSLDGGSLGSLGAVTGEESSRGELTPESGAVCELPGLGGSVAKFYPLLGIDGVPTGVLDLITTALDSFPNLLDIVGGEGGGAASLEQAGSLADGLCDTFLGGELILPPVTVIVDEDGVPVSTVTGTATPRSSATTSTLTAAADTGDGSGSGDPEGQASGGALGSDAEAAGDAEADGDVPAPTSVPTP